MKIPTNTLAIGGNKEVIPQTACESLMSLNPPTKSTIFQIIK